MSSLSKTAKQFQRHYETLITGDIHPIGHPVAKGDAREHGWRELFRRFLPNRYGVKSGFVIDSLGKESDQMDCIIYRKDMAIELYSVGHHTVIPVEAVFGAFEIKPLMKKSTLEYAEQKAESITKLTLTNYLSWDSVSGELKDDLVESKAESSIILGLLVDKLEAKRKWQVSSFKKFLCQPNSKLSVFMTVEDGCSDTFCTGYPTEEYTFYKGEHALLNQLIRLVEGFAYLEKARNLQSCCLSKYKNHLDQPKTMKV